MRPPAAVNRTFFASLLGFSLLGFGFSCFIAYNQDAQRVSGTGQLAWQHLLYAEDLKDDMGIIDWSKNLEKLDDILAFQALSGSKVIAEGGNRNFLPTTRVNGVSYTLPSTWVFHQITPVQSFGPRELTLVFKFPPGPFAWGLLTGFFCLLTGLGIQFLGASASTQPTTIPASSPAAPESRAIAFKPQPVDMPPQSRKKPYLFLDNNYVVQQVSPEAARLLQKKSEDILNGHLLDLEPTPTLMEAIERSEEVRLANPFVSNPKLSVSLKPDTNGILLFLETAD